MSLKVYILPTLKLIFVLAVLNTVSSISNVHSLYQCSCKQCCTIAVYAMCYTVNSLYSGHCRDLEVVSSLARVRNSESLFQSSVCKLFLPGI